METQQIKKAGIEATKAAMLGEPYVFAGNPPIEGWFNLHKECNFEETDFWQWVELFKAWIDETNWIADEDDETCNFGGNFGALYEIGTPDEGQAIWQAQMPDLETLQVWYEELKANHAE